MQMYIDFIVPAFSCTVGLNFVIIIYFVGLMFLGGAMLFEVLISAIVYKHRQCIRRKAQSSLSKAQRDMLSANNSCGKLARIFTGK